MRILCHQSILLTAFLLGCLSNVSKGFTAPFGVVQRQSVPNRLFMSDKKPQDGVVELADDEDTEKPLQANPVAPFLSQGDELAEGVLNPDLSDPKQTRVIIYIILSLLPVLFLIPLMLGSRDLIPLDSLPPVDL